MTITRTLLLTSVLAVSAGCPKQGMPNAETASDTAPAHATFPATMPAVQADYTWSPPPPEVLTTVGGAQLWHVHRHGLPLVSVRIMLPGGSALDPADQPGLTAFADDMVLRGAGDLDAAAFSAALQAEAIDLSVSTDRDSTILSLDCTVDNLPTAMRLLHLAVTRPRFDPAETERAREQRIQSRRDALDDPRSVAATVGWQHFFGADSPYAHHPMGTGDALATMTPDSLSANWRARAQPQQARWAVVGDLDADATRAIIAEYFGAWTGEATANPVVPPPPGRTTPAASGGRILIDNPGASQTVLRVWLPGWTASDPNRVAGDLGTVVLGGTFTSRLNALLREEKGYTYGARARLSTGRGYGTIAVSTNVVIDQTGPALSDLAAELQRFAQGISAEEAGKAEASRRTDAIEITGSRAATADLLAGLAADGRNADGQLADLHMAARAEAEGVNRVIAHLSLDDSLVVVVGDLERIRADVESALPGVWNELDASGNPVP